MKENKSRIKLIVGGLDDEGYEELVVFIYIDDIYFALINQEKGKDNLEIEFSNSKMEKIELELMNEALYYAKEEILK